MLAFKKTLLSRDPFAQAVTLVLLHGCSTVSQDGAQVPKGQRSPACAPLMQRPPGTMLMASTL